MSDVKFKQSERELNLAKEDDTPTIFDKLNGGSNPDFGINTKPSIDQEAQVRRESQVIQEIRNVDKNKKLISSQPTNDQKLDDANSIGGSGDNKLNNLRKDRYGVKIVKGK